MLELDLSLLDKTATVTIIIFVGAIAGEYAYRVTKRILQEAKIVNKLKAIGLNKPINTLSNLSRFAVYLFIFLILIKLEIVQFFVDVLGLLLIIFIVFALLFIVKDLVKNIYFSSKIKQKLKPGQHIETTGLSGYINKVSLGKIKITTKDRNLAVISKEFLAKNKFKIHK